MRETKNDPLAQLFVSPDYIRGNKDGRAYERAIADKEIQGIVASYERQLSEWRKAHKKLLKLAQPKRGLFGLKAGEIILTKKYKTREAAEAARKEIYKPEQISRVTIVEI